MPNFRHCCKLHDLIFLPLSFHGYTVRWHCSSFLLSIYTYWLVIYKTNFCLPFSPLYVLQDMLKSSKVTVSEIVSYLHTDVAELKLNNFNMVNCKLKFLHSTSFLYGSTCTIFFIDIYTHFGLFNFLMFSLIFFLIHDPCL